MHTIRPMGQRSDFKVWINQAFFTWRGSSRKSVSDFARELKISQQVMNGWLNYGSIPSNKNLIALAERFPEVYDVLGLPRPVLSSENTRLLFSAAKELSRSVKALGIDINSPEYESLFIEVFSRFGIKVEKMD